MANSRGGSYGDRYEDDNETEVFPSAYSHGRYSNNDYQSGQSNQGYGTDNDRYRTNESGYGQTYDNYRENNPNYYSGSGNYNGYNNNQNQPQASRPAPQQYENRSYGGAQYQQNQNSYAQNQSWNQAPVAPAPAAPKKPSLADSFDIPRYVGSVIAVAVVAALTAYFVGWVIDLVIQKLAQNFTFTYIPMDRVFYAVFAALVALLAGLLWWLLNIVTTLPSLFYNWIVGVVLAAAVILPLLLNDPFYNGILQSVMHLVVGLPVVYLIAPIGNSAVRRN